MTPEFGNARGAARAAGPRGRLRTEPAPDAPAPFRVGLAQCHSRAINATRRSLLPRARQTVTMGSPVPPEPNIIVTPAVLLLIAAATAGTHAPALTCPAGSQPEGTAPPQGSEWRCVDAEGRANGPWLTWYASGQLLSERQMKDGKEHGRQRSWWPNGQLMMEGVSVEGHRYQGFRYWSITGEPTEVEVRTETVRQPAPATAP